MGGKVTRAKEGEEMKNDQGSAMVPVVRNGSNYRAVASAVNEQLVSSLVADAAAGMKAVADPTRRVPLSDVEMVRAVTCGYLEHCSARGVLPSMSGLALCLGCSRQALYAHIRRNPDSETAEWLMGFSDVCGELVMQASLSGAVQAIPAIFIAKCRYGWKENVADLTVEPKQTNLTADAIVERYADLPDD